MAFHVRVPTGIYWNKHRARTHKMCYGDEDCNIVPGQIYYALRYRMKANPAFYCTKCAKKHKHWKDGTIENR